MAVDYNPTDVVESCHERTFSAAEARDNLKAVRVGLYRRADGSLYHNLFFTSATPINGNRSFTSGALQRCSELTEPGGRRVRCETRYEGGETIGFETVATNRSRQLDLEFSTLIPTNPVNFLQYDWINPATETLAIGNSDLTNLLAVPKSRCLVPYVAQAAPARHLRTCSGQLSGPIMTASANGRLRSIQRSVPFSLEMELIPEGESVGDFIIRDARYAGSEDDSVDVRGELKFRGTSFSNRNGNFVQSGQIRFNASKTSATFRLTETVPGDPSERGRLANDTIGYDLSGTLQCYFTM